MESLLLTLSERGPAFLLRRRNPFASLWTEDAFLAGGGRAAAGLLSCAARCAAALLGRTADAPPHERAHLAYLIVDLLFLRFQALQSSL